MKKSSVNLTGLSESVRIRNVAFLNSLLTKLTLLWGQWFQLFWLTEDSVKGRLCREQSILTTRHINFVGRRIVQLGGSPEMDIGALVNRNLYPQGEKPGEALIAESITLASLREELQAISIGGDWGSEDLLRQILREREDLLCRFGSLDNQEVLEHILDDAPLSMEEDDLNPVNPIH